MGKRALKQATYAMYRLFQQAPLAASTRASYQAILKQALQQLDRAGYRLHTLAQLKQKHVRYLVNHWQTKQAGTLKNRLAALRYVCSLMGKRDVVLTNTAYDIEARHQKHYAPIHLDLTQLSDPWIRQAVWLQQQFGLRREECLKFNPSLADQGNYIQLKGSWTKGGKPRMIPITTTEQRRCLEAAKTLCGAHSLIPLGQSYIRQRYRYEAVTRKAGLSHLHRLRHHYAQQRYAVLTQQLTRGRGWFAPRQGGPTRLTSAQRRVDQHARQCIAYELGHSRRSIVNIYVN